MSAATGGLLFALIRRLAGSLVALLTWLIWISAFPVIYFHASYMSEVPTSMLVLVSWWGLLRWRDDDRSRWLLLAAAAVAWCVITRPLTGLALALAAFAVATKIVVRRRAWRDLALAMAMAGVVLSILPLWCWRTTGNPRLSPLALYTRTYVPFDRPGFGAIAANRPSARLPHDQWVTSEAFFEEHVRHVPAELPSIAARRLAMLDRDAWYEWRGGLRLFALLGLFLLGVEGLVAVGAFWLHFALYLSYAHPPQWTLYYLEQTPVAAFLTALGAAQIIFWAGRGAPLDPVGSRSAVTTLWRLLRRRELCPPRGGAWAGASFLTLAACFALIPTINQVRSQINGDHRYHESFQLAIDTLAGARALVFVRYAPNHLDGLSLVRNEPDLEHARVWTVYDRGGENELLLDLDPTRTPYLFDESTWVLRDLQRLPRPTRTSGVTPADLPLASASRR
jgi:hypothetical protein